MTDIGMILQKLGGTLVGEVVPKLEGDYAGGQAGMAGMMAVMAGEAWDGAADRLYREVEGMRALLAAGGVEIKTQPDSFKLSDLNAVRNTLADELIELQTRLETADDEASKALNTQIWGFLLAGAAERMPNPPQFEEETS
ncbi:MAG: hypothetical protein AAFW65_08065 [Pseudomonadota bacterium]